MDITYHIGNILKTPIGKDASENANAFFTVKKPNVKQLATDQMQAYHLDYRYPVKLSQVVGDTLLKSLIKQEFIFNYNAVYEQERRRFIQEHGTTNPYVLKQEFPKELEQAKIAYFQNLFHGYEDQFLRFVTPNSDLNEIAEHAILKRKILTDNQLVLQVVIFL